MSSLATLLKESKAGADKKAPAKPKATFAAVRRAMRDDQLSDDEAEVALLAYLDRYMGTENED